MAEPGGIHLRSGEPRFLEDAIEGNRSQQRQKEEQAAEFGPEGPRAQVKLSNGGDIGRGRPRAGWALVVGPARQPRESFFLEDLCDGDRAERASLVGQVATDVVDGEVLFAQGDDTVGEGIGLGCGMRPLGRFEEEVASRVLAELVDEDSEAPRRVTVAASDLGTGNPCNEEGAEGLVLAVGGVGGFEEDLGKVRSICCFTGKHAPQMSFWGSLVKAEMANREKTRKNGDKRKDQRSWIGLLTALNTLYL